MSRFLCLIVFQSDTDKPSKVEPIKTMVSQQFSSNNSFKTNFFKWSEQFYPRTLIPIAGVQFLFEINLFLPLWIVKLYHHFLFENNFIMKTFIDLYLITFWKRMGFHIFPKQFEPVMISGTSKKLKHWRKKCMKISAVSKSSRGGIVLLLSLNWQNPTREIQFRLEEDRCKGFQ